MNKSNIFFLQIIILIQLFFFIYLIIKTSSFSKNLFIYLFLLKNLFNLFMKNGMLQLQNQINRMKIESDRIEARNTFSN